MPETSSFDLTGQSATNSELKLAAGDKISTLEEALLQVVGKLKTKLDVDQAATFDRSQATWELYREAVADYQKSAFQGGTNASLASAMSQIRLIEDRIKLLEANILDLNGIS